jgi:hypothetical protein
MNAIDTYERKQPGYSGPTEEEALAKRSRKRQNDNNAYQKRHGVTLPYDFLGSFMSFFRSTPRAAKAAKALKALMKTRYTKENAKRFGKTMHNLYTQGNAATVLRELSAKSKQYNTNYTGTRKNGVVQHTNPLAVRSRTGSTASSTASDPRNLGSIVGINEHSRSGVPYSELTSKEKAALKESFKQTFGRKFPAVNTSSKSQRVAQRIAEGHSRAAALEANQSRRAASKAREVNQASKLLKAFSNGLSKRGASELSPAQLALLSYRKK